MQSASNLDRRFAALAAMGFERLDQVVVEREIEPLAGRDYRVVHRRPAMGTGVAVSAVVRSTAQADEAIGRTFEEMDRLVAIFSHHESSSAAALLNQLGRLEGPPPELTHVVVEAQRYYHLTEGNFDITVAPVVELFRECRGRGTLPGRAEVREAVELVGTDHLAFSEHRIDFSRRGMRLTLDGIAKGYIVDAMARVLDRHRISHYLLEAGGDIRVRGCNGRRRPWTIAIQDPDGGTGFPDQLELIRGAVATSGSYEEFYDPERQHHHIVSAANGASPQQVKSVTVTAASAMAADALATSVFLMEPREGLRFLDNLRGCEGLIIGQDDSTSKTRGWRSAILS